MAEGLSPSGSPKAPPGRATDEPRVGFYVLEDASSRARLLTACRIIEKAYLAGRTVLVWHTSAEELRELDELLWTFGAGSFVPHEALGTAGFDAAPVLLSAGMTPASEVDVLVNLGPEVPPCADRARRIVELIDGDPQRRQAGRARFRAYRERGLQPATHNIRAGQAPG